MTTTVPTTPVELAEPAGRCSIIPFGRRAAAAFLVVGAAGNTAQAVLAQVLGGRPETVAEQIALAGERTALVTSMSLTGTLAVPFMAAGFVVAGHLLRRRANRTGVVASVLLVLGMFGFMAVQTAELIQLDAMLDPAGRQAAEYLQAMDSSVLLGVVFGAPFMLGCVLGMLTLTVGMLATGALPRWIPALWLVFIVLDFSIGAVGPVDPHWLYLAGAVGMAHHVLTRVDRPARKA